MKNKLKIGLVIILSLLVLFNIKLYLDKEKDKGFLGIEFGEKLSNLKVLDSYEAKNGEKFYNVEVDKKFRKEGYKYTVNVVPETNQVYIISARKIINGKNFKEECFKERDKIEKEINNNNNYYFGRNSIENTDVYLNNNVFIYVACTDINNYIVLSYNDKSLYNKYIANQD